MSVTTPTARLRTPQLLAGGVGGLFILLVIVIAIAMWQGVGDPVEGRSDAAGQAVPFTVPLFAGGDWSLDDYPFSPVFVYFWASWCLPCEEEAPVIQRLWPEYRDRGYAFVGINIWDQEADARAFINRFRLTFPLARDADRSVYVEYGVQGLPTAFFIEPGLHIRSRYDGRLDESTLRMLLDELAGDTP
jgi:cytochrome c biogenesis protein CcmG, thiol:disulfide interchange protein DsbE